MKDVVMSSPGKIKIDGKKIPLNDFANLLVQEGDSPPTFDNIPILSAQVNERLAISSGMAVRKSLDNASLVVNIRMRNLDGNFATSHLKFSPGADGKFLVRGEHGLGIVGSYPLAEIIERCKSQVQN